MVQIEAILIVVFAVAVAHLTFAILKVPGSRNSPAADQDAMALLAAALALISIATCAAHALGLFDLNY